jgi:hypothetical protein
MANTYVLVSSATSTGSETSFIFSSIPQTYTDLVLRISARSTQSGYTQNFLIRYNGDTATNYSSVGLYGSGANANGFEQVSQNGASFIGMNYATSLANTFGNTEAYIPNYTATGVKSVINLGATEHNTSTTQNSVGALSNLYRGTSAITSILVRTVGGADVFTTGSTLYLYGIKKN